MYKSLFFFALLVSGIPSLSAASDVLNEALKTAQNKKLHERVEWIRLGHYNKRFFRWESEADGKEFFAAPDGAHDPQAELEATLRGFFSEQKRTFKDTRHPAQTTRCQFPARWMWLSKELQLKDSDLPTQECTEFNAFHKKLEAKSATLVFASYNTSNPSSTFGHTLLRFNRYPHGHSQGVSLLDVGVNFAANPWTNNAVLYAAMGLSGFFPGTYTALQYFYKVREYSDFDARDLWEYNLNLSQEELELAIAHIWELGFTYFNYYFFTSNCSYHILTLLDVAAPRLNLVDQLSFWVIPADTIKAAWRTQGLVQDVVYRPSLQNQLGTRLSKLKTDEEMQAYSQLQATWNAGNLPQNLSPEDRAKVLDAAIDKYDLINFRKLIDKNAPEHETKNKLLIARSHLPSTPSDPILARDDQKPHLSHDSIRFSFSNLTDNYGQNAFEVTQRFALHDLADPVDGYPRSAMIEFFKLTVNGGYKNSSKFFIRNIDLFSVQTINPFTTIDKPISWKIRIAADHVLDKRCADGCLAGTIEGNVGFTLGTPSSRLLFYTLLQNHIRTAPGFARDKFTLETGPQFGLRYLFTNSLIFHGETGWQWILGMNQRLPTTNLRLRWGATQDWAFDVGYRYQYFQQNFIASVNYYY
ncbi:MAG: DUF4105 domain-containing protein [Bdellovibrionaceae bacterium]|nr:DUF4105 domain-containing protein [Pseudobdellovibrionaceae bacterium]